MKAAGLFLLIAGFVLVVSALVLLSPNAPRGAFVVAGIAVQILGLALTFRAHLSPDEGR
jgi:membrane-bound ClpP family serine protease